MSSYLEDTTLGGWKSPKMRRVKAGKRMPMDSEMDKDQSSSYLHKHLLLNGLRFI